MAQRFKRCSFVDLIKPTRLSGNDKTWLIALPLEEMVGKELYVIEFLGELQYIVGVRALVLSNYMVQFMILTRDELKFEEVRDILQMIANAECGGKAWTP